MMRAVLLVAMSAALVVALPPSLLSIVRTPPSATHTNSMRPASVSSSASSTAAAFPAALWYPSQAVDHFNGADTRVFRQRYFLNATYFNPVNGPVFLCVGGEGPPLDGSVVVASVHCNDAVELAITQRALIVALEHRYYGLSNPVSDYTTENLKYLSAHQALADLAQFRDWLHASLNLTPANKWVSFGGSYPGMLAGWFHLNYPHLTVAAVASSAPVKAQLNMQGYNDVVADALAATSVGGSQACLAAVKAGHANVGTLLADATGRSKLTSMFNLCSPATLENADNRIDWAGNGVIQVPAQSNDPSCTDPGCDISRICTVMLDTSRGTPIERLAALSSIQNRGQCVYVNHQAAIDALTNTSIAAGDSRIWFYQTCSEFAFYQTCDASSRCPFTTGLNDLASNTKLCAIAYGIQPDQIANRVAFANTFWGADKPAGRRVMYVNGEVDPWRSLSILSSPGAELPVLNVNGASHHFWTHPTLPSDSADVVAARRQIWSTVTGWLQSTD